MNTIDILYQVQWDMNDGKCGVCGDPWQGPRENEPGGKYANGIIVRKYQPGEIITVGIDLTANHYGYFEFRLCPNDNPFERVTHECFNKHLLKLAKTGKTKFQLLESEGIMNKIFKIELKLPYVRCSDCVLQWKYNAGRLAFISPIVIMFVLLYITILFI